MTDPEKAPPVRDCAVEPLPTMLRAANGKTPLRLPRETVQNTTSLVALGTFAIVSGTVNMKFAALGGGGAGSVFPPATRSSPVLGATGVPGGGAEPTFPPTIVISPVLIVTGMKSAAAAVRATAPARAIDRRILMRSPLFPLSAHECLPHIPRGLIIAAGTRWHPRPRAQARGRSSESGDRSPRSARPRALRGPRGREREGGAAPCLRSRSRAGSACAPGAPSGTGA